MGREPLEILRLAEGLWYTERRDLITALYTLLRVRLSWYQFLSFLFFFIVGLVLVLSLWIFICCFSRLLYLTRGLKLILWLTFRSIWKILSILVLDSGWFLLWRFEIHDFVFYKCLLKSIGYCSSVLVVIMLTSQKWVVTVKNLDRI